jgi:four helix bundle protein
MTNVKDQKPNETQSPNEKVYDLEDRTARHGGEDIIEFAKSIERDEVNRPLISQVVRSATSIGANYMEADGAESKKGF